MINKKQQKISVAPIHEHMVQKCNAKCELLSGDEDARSDVSSLDPDCKGVENASSQAGHQRLPVHGGVNIQKEVSRGYKNTSINTGPPLACTVSYYWQPVVVIN